MPCPHFDIKIVQRSKRQSVVAAAAYQSGEKLYSEYDQKTKSYSEKQGIVHTEIMLPANAPPAYADRNTLWNAVEAVECQWNSQLARRFIMALPRELSREEQIKLMRDYCEQQFVSKGMVADIAIHDKGDGNPHAHVLLTLRPMDEQGHWLPKCRKVYDLDENGQRIKLPSGNWKSHRENVVDWNDQKYGEVWRHEWEVLQNAYLERAGCPERVDLRSFERQGNPHAPQVHLGPAASAMERRGVKTNLGNLNRDIVSANKLYDAIRRTIKNLQGWLAELAEKISESQQPQEPNLAEILAEYLDLRKAGRADWYFGAQRKGQINDLKQVSETVIFLKAHNITTVHDLGNRLNELADKGNALRSQIKASDKRSSDIDAILTAGATVQKLKSVHEKYVKIGWKLLKEKFAADHADELREYNSAFRLLKKFDMGLPLDTKALRTEQAALKKSGAAMLAELETVRDEVEKLKQVRWCVRQVMPDALPTMQEKQQAETKRQSVLERLAEKQRKAESEQIKQQYTPPPPKPKRKKHDMEL